MLRRARDIREQFRQTGEVFTQDDYSAAVQAACLDLEEDLIDALVDWAVQQPEGEDAEIDTVTLHLHSHPVAAEVLKIAREVRKGAQQP
jgi:hypothetical protein